MKVKCVKCLRTERYFTPGKVYKVKHGKITNDRGYTYEEETNSEVLEFLSGWYLFEKVKKDNIGFREVKRRAKKGEYVKIVDAIASYGNYKNGDILKIVDDVDYVRYGYGNGQYLYDSEYVVLEGYKPDKQDEPKEQQCKFKVGERYRVCISTEKGNTIEITETKGDRVFYKIISGKPGITGNNFDRNSLFAKSLVMIAQKVLEELSKLYNGKIIFTKGDGMFKTGHIYEVKDGRIAVPIYESLPIKEPLKDIEDVKDYFTGNLDGNRKRENGWSPYTLELMEVKED